MAKTENRGRNRAVAFVAAAVVLGAMAVGLTTQLVGYYETAIETAGQRDTVRLVMAANDLYAGIPIAETDLVYIDVDRMYLPGGSTDGLLTYAEEIVGRTPHTRILSNEYIHQGRLSDATDGTGLNGLVQPGMRALSIPLGDGAALDGLLEPASFVDVMVTVAPEDNRRRVQTVTVAAHIYVLAVNGRSDTEVLDARQQRKRVRTKPTVTLMVDGIDAERIAHASHQGRITLAVINPKDEPQVDVVDFGVPEEPVGAPGTPVMRPVIVQPPVIEAAPDWVIQLCKGRSCVTETYEVAP